MPKLICISKNELKNLYEGEKLTTYEIADTYNCCQATIWKRLKKYQIKCLPNGRKTFIISKPELKNLYINQRLSSRKIAKVYKRAYSTIDYKIREFGFPIKTLAAAHITTPRRDFNGNNTDKAYLIGFAMGDLRVRKKYPNSETINVDCGSTKKEQIFLISKLFKPYGGIWISRPNKRGAVQIECFLNKSFEFLLKKRTLIDPWILKNKECFWAFLAGFTDAEGCISVSNRGAAYYSLGNYNRPLLSRIRNRLIQSNISCSKLYESKTKGRLCFGKYFHNQNYWQLRICNKDSLLTLFELISPYLKHSIKKRDIKIARNNIEARNKGKNKILCNL